MSNYQASVTCTPEGPYDNNNGISDRGLYMLQHSKLVSDLHAIYRWLEKARDADPSSPQVLFCFGNIEYLLEEHQSAQDHFQLAQDIVGVGQDPKFDASFAKWLKWWQAVKEADAGDSLPRLVRVGFHRAAIDHLSQESPSIRNSDAVISILKDTEKALAELTELVRDRNLLTPPSVLHLHASIMQHSRFDEAEEDALRLKYLARVGNYRVLYSGTSLQQNEDDLVAFAPPERISEEMTNFLNFAQDMNKSVLEGDTDLVNAIKSAAWMHSAFTTIHPFADGNGRMVRLLASIPLLRAKLPPMVIPLERRSSYLEACTVAQRDGNLDLLIAEIIQGLQSSLTYVANLPPLTPEDNKYKLRPEGGHSKHNFAKPPK
ncbi:Fic-domain-containing protein [Phlegmacium glaucopus]|nr:Fic-domain-containing protein [Phlegmacium glaucopus]